MKDKLFLLFLKLFLLVTVVFIGGSFWYYMFGRKPKLVISAPISTKTASPISYRPGHGELLLLVGGKVTLYDTSAGREKWSAQINAPTPAPVPTATPVLEQAAPALAPEGKNDPMRQILQARIARSSARLDQWSAELNAKRANLTTDLQRASFKEEEAKYQAALAEARAEKAALGESLSGASVTALDLADAPVEDWSFARHQNIFSNNRAIWIVQGRTVRMLDHANGRLLKEIALGNDCEKVMQGEGCWYLVAKGGGNLQQITRINAADGAAQAVNVIGESASPDFGSSYAAQATPLQRQRTELSAGGAELAQLEVRLLEEKITERKALKSDSASDWEAADKKTTGGWANDAVVVAQAMANDAQREITGGIERVDEGTYEVTLRRPFQTSAAASAPIKVQGRPSLFSTASFDLVATGKTLIAFDHGNKKLWQGALSFPLPYPFEEEAPTATLATTTRPCVEDEKRLYFFDRGFLTAFDRTSGTTLWRLPSVGIRKVQLDGDNLLYVTSANSDPKTLQYSQETGDPSLPVILKVDRRTGKILWQVDKYQDCFVSDGIVYAVLEGRNPNDLVDSVFQRSKAVTARFKLYKLSARDGKVQWEWFQPRRPVQIEADKRKVALLFDDELQILSSIAF